MISVLQLKSMCIPDAFVLVLQVHVITPLGCHSRSGYCHPQHPRWVKV
jgi:hypothetical protein